MCSTVCQRLLLAATLASILCSAACGGVFKRQYEYEEELFLALDGSATLNLNASVAALVALRGADLDVNPRARVDRGAVRALFEGPGAEVLRVSLSRRDGRRFVHVSVDLADLRQARGLAPFAWSEYRLARQGEVVQFRQRVGAAAGRDVGDVGWGGSELVAFRVHLPSAIPFHNSAKPIQRGNILEWEQPLADRLAGTPLDIEVDMEPESILYTTLLLFGGTIVAACAAFGLVLWLFMRRGRDAGVPAARG
jgi:hypothetical protein